MSYKVHWPPFVGTLVQPGRRQRSQQSSVQDGSDMAACAAPQIPSGVNTAEGSILRLKSPGLGSSVAGRNNKGPVIPPATVEKKPAELIYIQTSNDDIHGCDGHYVLVLDHNPKWTAALETSRCQPVALPVCEREMACCRDGRHVGGLLHINWMDLTVRNSCGKYATRDINAVAEMGVARAHVGSCRCCHGGGLPSANLTSKLIISLPPLYLCLRCTALRYSFAGGGGRTSVCIAPGEVEHFMVS